MSDDRKFKIKFEKKVKIEKDGKTENYIVRTKGGEEQEIAFSKDVKDGEESKGTVPLQFRKEDGEKDKWEEFSSKAKYKHSFLTDGVELVNKKLGSNGPEMKEAIKPSVGIFKSWNWPVYLIIVVVILAIAGLIWWWVASSRSEDKEEEGL